MSQVNKVTGVSPAGTGRCVFLALNWGYKQAECSGHRALPCCEFPRRERAPCLGQEAEPRWGVPGFILLLLHALAWGGGQSSGQASYPLSLLASPASQNPPAAFEEVTPERGEGSSGQTEARKLLSPGEGMAGPPLCCD